MTGAARSRAEVAEAAITTVRGVIAELDDIKAHATHLQQTLASALVEFNASIEAPDPE